MQADAQRHEMAVQELFKEAAGKTQAVEEARAREREAARKMEEMEAKHRAEVEKLLDKLQQTATGSMDKDLAT